MEVSEISRVSKPLVLGIQVILIGQTTRPMHTEVRMGKITGIDGFSGAEARIGYRTMRHMPLNFVVRILNVLFTFLERCGY